MTKHPGQSIICSRYVELKKNRIFNRAKIIYRSIFVGLRLPGSQQGVRLLWVKISKCEGRGALAEPEEPYRTADWWRRGASKIRLEG